MIAENVAFGIIAAAMALGAIGVVRTKNVVHAALYLVVVLAGGAAEFILLGQEFVAWVQVLVYIGAVIVLFLFGIMLTRAPMHPKDSLDNNLRWPAAVTALFLVGILVGLFVHTFHADKVNVTAPGAHGGDHERGVHHLHHPVRSRRRAPARRAHRRRRAGPEGLGMLLNEFLILAAFLFCTGIYGVLVRKHAVLVLMSIEFMLAGVNINLVAFGAFHNSNIGQVFALFVLTIAAAEVGIGLAIVLLIYRNLHSADLDDVDTMKG